MTTLLHTWSPASPGPRGPSRPAGRGAEPRCPWLCDRHFRAHQRVLLCPQRVPSARQLISAISPSGGRKSAPFFFNWCHFFLSDWPRCESLMLPRVREGVGKHSHGCESAGPCQLSKCVGSTTTLPWACRERPSHSTGHQGCRRGMAWQWQRTRASLPRRWASTLGPGTSPCGDFTDSLAQASPSEALFPVDFGGIHAPITG